MVDSITAAGRFVTAPLRTGWNALHTASNCLQLACSANPIGMAASKAMTGSWTAHAKTDLADIKSDGGHMLAAGAQTVALACAVPTGGMSCVPGFAAAYVEQKMSA